MTEIGQLTPGTRVGRYEIVRLVGAGGMGEVYQATHEFTKKSVALKVLKIAHEGREALVEKMRAEAMLLCRIRHEHLVEVYDAGVDDGRIWMAMELLDGESLRERLMREGATRPELALDWIAQIAEGLSGAHDAGVIHRDLKPENIFITRGGKLKVLDFGTAKFEGFGHSQTKASERMGTLPYMSPEHLAGEPLDARSDVFAVGIIFYEVLAGRHPFASPEGALPALRELLGMMLAGTPESLAPFVGDEVWSLVARCIAPRDERFANMRELSAAARALRAKISGVSSGALRLGISGQTQLGSSLGGAQLTPPPVAPTRGIAGPALAALALAAALLGAGAVVVTQGPPSAATPADETGAGASEAPSAATSEPTAGPAAIAESEVGGEAERGDGAAGGPTDGVADADGGEAGSEAPAATAAPVPVPVVRPTWSPPQKEKKKSDEPFRDDEPFKAGGPR